MALAAVSSCLKAQLPAASQQANHHAALLLNHPHFYPEIFLTQPGKLNHSHTFSFYKLQMHRLVVQWSGCPRVTIFEKEVRKKKHSNHPNYCLFLRICALFCSVIQRTQGGSFVSAAANAPAHRHAGYRPA